MLSEDGIEGNGEPLGRDDGREWHLTEASSERFTQLGEAERNILKSLSMLYWGQTSLGSSLCDSGRPPAG